MKREPKKVRKPIFSFEFHQLGRKEDAPWLSGAFHGESGEDLIPPIPTSKDAPEGAKGEQGPEGYLGPYVSLTFVEP